MRLMRATGCGGRRFRALPAWLRRATVAGVAALSGLAIVLAALCLPVPAHADSLPAAAELEQRLGLKPQAVEVIEPHLTTPASRTRRRYVGWPAAAVFDKLLPPTWKDEGMEIEFRALDGYVARVPAGRFARYSAFLVFARADGSPFTVDNIAQNEKDVPLGPYYLVWDNIRDGELVKEGASFWPYQVSEMRAAPASLRVLLPGDLGTRYAAEAQLTQKLCLSCHQVNGYGGDKYPINLAERAKDMAWQDFRRQVMTPRAANAQALMPPMLETEPDAAREATARRLYDYLRAVPVPTP
jgi:hypothetical protein